MLRSGLLHAGVLAIFYVMPAGALAQNLHPDVIQDIQAIQADKLERTPAERKLASQLLYLARESAGTPAVAGAPSLRSRVVIEADGRVPIRIVATPNASLRGAIERRGGVVGFESARFGSVNARVPASALLPLAERDDATRVTCAGKLITHTGSVTSEGDAAHRAISARSTYGVDGTGVRVGVISDSADFSANAISLGDLPASFTVLPNLFGSGSGEGTAMSEIVHDLAPGAEIYFASGVGGKSAFASAILALDAAGCHVIVDDLSYSNEWQFQDDQIAQAVNTVVSNGKLYLSSSGNEGSLKNGNSTTWEGDFSDAGSTGAPLPSGSSRLHSFGAQTYNFLPNDSSEAWLQWSDEYNSSANDYDMYVLNAAGTSVVASSTDTQSGASEPFEFIGGVQPNERIVVVKFSGAARYLRLSCTGGPLDVQTAGQAIGHASTPNCITVASSDAFLAFPGPFTTSSSVESSSSDGPRKLFYEANGTPITPGNFLASGGVTVPSPDLTAADGVVTSLPPGGLNPFFGTSAAAPHAAAIAALVWSHRPTFTNAQVRAILEWSCLDIEDPGFDVNSGNGILMADLALERAGWTSTTYGCATAATGVDAPTLTVTAGVSRLGGSFEVTAADVSPTATSTFLSVHGYFPPAMGPKSSVLLADVCYNLSLAMPFALDPITVPSTITVPLPTNPALDGVMFEAQIFSVDPMSPALVPVTASLGLSIRLAQ